MPLRVTHRFGLTKNSSILLVGLLASVVALVTLPWLPISLLRLVFTWVLVCFLPGWALVEGVFALPEERLGLGVRLLLGLGAGYVVTIVGGLWIYYALGRITFFSLWALYAAVGLLGFGVALWRRFSKSPASLSAKFVSYSTLWLSGLLILAAYFRFYYLTYSDFRGDEAEVVLRAVAAIRGVGQPILSHTKGPAETLLATAVGLLYGAFDEGAIRFPFALANWLAVIGTYKLGQRVFDRRVSFMAGALVAINGYFITYGRTAQYQNLVLFLSILAVWRYVRFYQGGSYANSLLGTLFLATATFGHYEGASAALVALYLMILGLKRRGVWGWQTLRTNKSTWLLGLSLFVGGVVVLSFYAPFILNPTVAGAQSHLAKRFGNAFPYNNWDHFYSNGLYYNSMYYMLGVGSVLLLGTLRGIKQALGERRWSTVAAVISLPLLLLSWTGLLPAWYGLMIYLGLMGLFLFSSRVSVSVKAMLLWVLMPLGLYLFAVERPGNHYYVFMPPLMLLAALTLKRGLDWLGQLQWPGSRWALSTVIGVLLILYGLSTWHEHLVFMRTDLEYLLTYPQHRNPIFFSDRRYPFDIRIGWGFPYRLGWQTVSELYRSGQLAGDWYGTDENNSIFWYTLGWPRNPCYPRYFMLTEIGYHETPLEVPRETIERHYALRATVQVNGQPRLQLYEFAPLGSDASPVVYDEPMGYPTPYRQEMLHGHPLTGPVLHPSTTLNPSVHFKPHPDMLAELAGVYGDARIIQVQDEVTLLGYDIDDAWAVPGGVVLLTLYWETDTKLVFPYKVFAHLEDTQLWAQADDEPGCAQFPTYGWQAGDRIIDRHAIFLPTDIPSGEYTLQVGIYERRTGLRMDVLDELGNPAGNSLALPAVSIRSRD